MAGLKYKICSLGCKVNQYDGGKLGGLLESAGFILGEKNVDLIIINTCAVTKIAIAKGRQALSRLKRENPRAKAVLMGCFPKVYEKDINIKELGVDILWKVGDAKKLIKKIFNLFELFQSKCAGHYNFNQNDLINKARYFLKIQDGCEQFCSYCIIPYTRGKLKSRLVEEILQEIKEVIKMGCGEIVLSGIHLGLFGINNITKEKEENINLTGLLKKMVEIKDLKKIRLSSIEITEVTDKLIEFMRKNKKMCRHLHIPLQSGCDKILKLMNRPYTIKYFENKVKKIRKAMADIAISTDVIVGFPGETNKDFKETEKFIKKIKFSRLHVFSFSAHEKTPAFSMDGKVGQEEIKNRSKTLRELSKKFEKNYYNSFKGKELEFVIEAIVGDKVKCKSEYYFDVWILKKDMPLKNISQSSIGEIVNVKVF